MLFFADENEPKFRRLHSLFEDPITKVYLLFEPANSLYINIALCSEVSLYVNAVLYTYQN